MIGKLAHSGFGWFFFSYYKVVRERIVITIYTILLILPLRAVSSIFIYLAEAPREIDQLKALANYL